LRQGPSLFSQINLTLFGGIPAASGVVIDWSTRTISAGVGNLEGPFLSDWYRLSTWVSNNSSGNVTARLTLYPAVALGPVALGSCGAWGAQIERQLRPTSYIPTVAAPVTRTADLLSVEGSDFLELYNPTQGTWIAGADKPYVDVVGGPVLTASNGTGANILGWSPNSAFTQADYFVNVGGAPLFNAGYPVSSLSAPFTVGLGYANSGFAVSANNGLIVASLGGQPLLDMFNRVNFGQSGAGGSLLNGHVRFVRYFNRKLTNAQLQAATTP
jgi:hypothetical protein